MIGIVTAPVLFSYSLYRLMCAKLRVIISRRRKCSVNGQRHETLHFLTVRHAQREIGKTLGTE
jgi:hypothetical protein